MVNQKEYFNSKKYKHEFRLLFYTSFGVFLFILFFQPFPLESFDQENRLLYVFGFLGITFLLASIILIIIPKLLLSNTKNEFVDHPSHTLFVLLVLLSITAYTFYIYYVGKTPINLYLLFRITLVCLIPVIILSITYKNQSLIDKTEFYKNKSNKLVQKLLAYENISGENKIELVSGNKADKLIIKSKDILFIRSADNYIEINYLENDGLKSKLLRNTLKDIENQLLILPNIIRIHRTCLINKAYLTKLKTSYKGHSVVLKYIDYDLPLAKQYLAIVKEEIFQNK